MTEQEFDNIPDDDLWITVHNSIYPKMPDYTIESVLQLPPPQQAVVLITWFENDMDFGGFDRFHYYSDGKYAIGENEQLLPTVLERVGADGCADVCRRANRALNEDRNKVLNSFSKANDEEFDYDWGDLFDSFDDEWYACIEKENLDELMIQFIRKHKSDFCEVQR